MEKLYTDLKRQIEDYMGDTFRMVDEDYGQVEAAQQGEDQYPIDTPCVLIGTPEVEWSCIKTGDGTRQHGKASFTVRAVFDCYDDTHSGSPDGSEGPEFRAETVRQLNEFIHGWRMEGCTSICIRTYSRGYTAGRMKVYETTYRTEMDS